MFQQPLISAIREFTGTILNPFDLEELLHRLMHHAITVIGAAGAGMLLAGDDQRLRFVAASEERVQKAELKQQEISSGACHEAFTSNRLVVVEDLEHDDRWPEYRERVVGVGLRSVLGVPLNAHGQTIGAMNVYRDQTGPWSDEDVVAAEILASMGAGYIVNANQLRAQHALTDQLRLALESRDLIGQAKGIIMARAGVDADHAFDLLRERSQRTNRKLRDVAQAVVSQQSAEV